LGSASQRWNADRLKMLAEASDDEPQRWTPTARLDAVIAIAGLDETVRGGHRVFPTSLDAWKRDAIGEPGAAAESAATLRPSPGQGAGAGSAPQGQDVGRKVAMLVLSKSSRRSSTRARTHDPPGISTNPGSSDHAGPRRRLPPGTRLRSGGDRPPHDPTLAQRRWTDTW
jgi:hypothetical protein